LYSSSRENAQVNSQVGLYNEKQRAEKKPKLGVELGPVTLAWGMQVSGTQEVYIQDRPSILIEATRLAFEVPKTHVSLYCGTRMVTV
jgi:hypothetical protein